MILDWMQTFTGKIFHFDDYDYFDFRIEDIAHSLSLQCRFNGHCKRHYSVAQHCVLGSYYADDDIELHFLLHDASECYLSDVVRGLKPSVYINFKGTNFLTYKDLEYYYLKDIYRALNLTPPNEEQATRIKDLDNRMLATEARDLFIKQPGWDIDDIKPFMNVIEPWNPDVSEVQFLAYYRRLTSGGG